MSVRFASTPPPMDPTRHVAIIGQVKGKDALLSALAVELRFPSYFGHNWDALFDCLKDLTWIPEREVAIFHEKVPLLAPSELRTYVSILQDAVDLQPVLGDDHVLDVIFPPDARLLVDSVPRNFP